MQEWEWEGGPDHHFRPARKKKGGGVSQSETGGGGAHQSPLVVLVARELIAFVYVQLQVTGGRSREGCRRRGHTFTTTPTSTYKWQGRQASTLKLRTSSDLLNFPKWPKNKNI